MKIPAVPHLTRKKCFHSDSQLASVYNKKMKNCSGKLVRDRIPEIIRNTGRTPRIHVLDPDAYAEALDDKLLEEAEELRAATADERLGEAADVLEVIIAIGALHGFDLADVVQAAREKATERGAFKDRFWLEHER